MGKLVGHQSQHRVFPLRANVGGSRKGRIDGDEIDRIRNRQAIRRIGGVVDQNVNHTRVVTNGSSHFRPDQFCHCRHMPCEWLEFGGMQHPKVRSDHDIHGQASALATEQLCIDTRAA